MCVVTHRQPEIRYTILASVYMVPYDYVVGLFLIPSCGILAIFDAYRSSWSALAETFAQNAPICSGKDETCVYFW